MTWLRLDAGFPDHPKVVGLNDPAFRLEVSAICYARSQLTDGHIPRAWVPSRLARHTGALVDARLWVPTDGGWELHDYLDWQQSRAEVEALTKNRAEAGRRGARARWQK